MNENRCNTGMRFYAAAVSLQPGISWLQPEKSAWFKILLIMALQDQFCPFFISLIPHGREITAPLIQYWHYRFTEIISDCKGNRIAAECSINTMIGKQSKILKL